MARKAAEATAEPETKEDGSQGEPAVSEETQRLLAEKEDLERQLAESLAKVAVLERPPDKVEEPLVVKRTFVAPAHKHEKVLVKAGVVKTRVNPGAPMDMAVQRDGDVWAHFRDGILQTEDPLVIAWCEGHPEFCRDAQDPQTKPWAILIEAQMETSTQDSRLPKNMDIGRLLEGDVSALVPGENIVDRALKGSA